VTRLPLNLPDRRFTACQAEGRALVSKRDARLRGTWASRNVSAAAAIPGTTTVLAKVVAAQTVRPSIKVLTATERVLVRTVACEALDRQACVVCIGARQTVRSTSARRPAEKRRTRTRVAVAYAEALAVADHTWTGPGPYVRPSVDARVSGGIERGIGRSAVRRALLCSNVPVQRRLRLSTVGWEGRVDSNVA
jgi:hypothetical protein